MYKYNFYIFFLLVSIGTYAQVSPKDSITKVIETEENDILFDEPILLDEVVVSNVKMDNEALKEFLKLQSRVYKVYPFAKTAAERMTILNRNMEKLKTNKEKRKYFKIVEDYMENEFTDQLKKLSRKQGQILVKLIYRQTGFTTFDLIKDYKSGWKAFWSNNTAKVFDINLKTKYDPYSVNEDFLIETILVRAFARGRLVEQKPAITINMTELQEHWESRAEK